MHPIPEDHPLKRYFQGLVEQAFYSELGVCDPDLTEYLTGLLVAFVHVDRIHALQDAEGRRLEQIAHMLLALDEGEEPEGEERHRVVHRHIGDYSLFWAGIYPERLHGRRRPTYEDQLIDYVAQGKRSYAIASDLTHGNEEPPAVLLNRLSQEFECCVHGLNRVRHGWESEPGDTPDTPGLLY